MFIPQSIEFGAVMKTKTAQRLVSRGAALYLLKDGKTNVLSIEKPADAFAKACGLHIFTGEAAA
jgi:hypothetical protein